MAVSRTCLYNYLLEIFVLAKFQTHWVCLRTSAVARAAQPWQDNQSWLDQTFIVQLMNEINFIWLDLIFFT